MLFNQLYELYQQTPAEEWRELSVGDGNSFIFKGSVTLDTISFFADKVHQLLAISDEMYNKLVFSVMVEMFQNVQKHSAERSESNAFMQSNGQGILLFEKISDKVVIIGTGNIIRNDSVKVIEDRCKFINRLNREQLREYYNMERRNSAATKRKGGNIGLIDIARKSGNPLDVRMTHINKKNTFYALGVCINQKFDNKNSGFE